jgi:hypothetical protein
MNGKQTASNKTKKEEVQVPTIHIHLPPMPEQLTGCGVGQCESSTEVEIETHGVEKLLVLILMLQAVEFVGALFYLFILK